MYLSFLFIDKEETKNERFTRMTRPINPTPIIRSINPINSSSRPTNNSSFFEYLYYYPNIVRENLSPSSIKSIKYTLLSAASASNSKYSGSSNETKKNAIVSTMLDRFLL